MHDGASAAWEAYLGALNPEIVSNTDGVHLQDSRHVDSSEDVASDDSGGGAFDQGLKSLLETLERKKWLEPVHIVCKYKGKKVVVFFTAKQYPPVPLAQKVRTLRFYAHANGAELLNAKVRVVIDVVGHGSSIASRECAMAPVLQFGSIETVGVSQALTTAFAVAQHSSELEQIDEGVFLQMDIDIRILDMADGEPDSGYDDMAREVRERVQVSSLSRSLLLPFFKTPRLTRAGERRRSKDWVRSAPRRKESRLAEAAGCCH